MKWVINKIDCDLHSFATVIYFCFNWGLLRETFRLSGPELAGSALRGRLKRSNHVQTARDSLPTLGLVKAGVSRLSSAAKVLKTGIP